MAAIINNLIRCIYYIHHRVISKTPKARMPLETDNGTQNLKEINK